MSDNTAIRVWMSNNVHRFVDECGEVNCTMMVETWDSECSDGESTLDPFHEAWHVAVKVAEEYEKRWLREKV
jgi:hypothetical protein